MFHVKDQEIELQGYLLNGSVITQIKKNKHKNTFRFDPFITVATNFFFFFRRT